MKIHSSCEIEDFVETHLCKLCVICHTSTRHAFLFIFVYFIFRPQKGRSRKPNVTPDPPFLAHCLSILATSN